MPSFLIDFFGGLWDFGESLAAYWRSLPEATRMLIAMLGSGLAVYGGSKTDHNGWSMVLYFGAFGLFAYVVIAGFSIVH
jgi:hypothetical protein